MSRLESNRETKANSPQLRNRFLVWSLAIAGSLSTTGTVSLNPISAWAQEAPAKAQKPGSKSLDKPLDQATFRKMLTAGELDELAKKVDAGLAERPEDSTLIGMNSTLAMYLIRQQPEAARARFEAQLQRLLAIKELNSSCSSSLSTAVGYLIQLNKEMSSEQKLAILDQGLAKIDARKKASTSLAVRRLVIVKSQLLAAENRHEEAKGVLDDYLDVLRKTMMLSNSQSMRSLVALAGSYSSILGGKFPDAAETILLEAEELASRAVDSDSANAGDFATLYGLKSMQVATLSNTDPERAEAMLNSLAEKLAGLKERLDESGRKGLSSYETAIGALRARLETALKRQQLIGTDAPEIDAEAFVAMAPTTMDDLKGKVVLIDFWAVWCGPCIATFPHLIEWHEEFADRGLVILGATGFYNYEWDDEAGKAMQADGDVDAQIEIAMLLKFRESYGLHHGFFVSGKDSDYSKQLQVSGIPQAVLIDKAGKIQMIRVGSDNANAEALHAKIEELLGG